MIKKNILKISVAGKAGKLGKTLLRTSNICHKRDTVIQLYARVIF